MELLGICNDVGDIAITSVSDGESNNALQSSSTTTKDNNLIQLMKHKEWTEEFWENTVVNAAEHIKSAHNQK